MPSAPEKQDVAEQHQQLAQQEAHLLAKHGQLADQRVNAQMTLLAHRNHCTQIGEPDERIPGHFFADHDARIEGVAHHHVAEHHDHHGEEAENYQKLKHPKKGIDDSLQRVLPSEVAQKR